jgi:hypothetical protein
LTSSALRLSIQGYKPLANNEGSQKISEKAASSKRVADTRTSMFSYHPHELWPKGKKRPEFEKALERSILHQMRAGGTASAAIVHRQAHTYLNTIPMKNSK